MTTILIQTERNIHVTLLLKSIKYENIYPPLHIYELRQDSYVAILHNNEDITDKLNALKMRQDKKYSTHSGLDIEKQLLKNIISHVKFTSPLSIKTNYRK